MWFSLLFAAPAHADLVLCLLQASAGAPAAGATDVPIDAVPAVLVDSYCSGLESELAVVLSTDDGAVVHEEAWTASSEAPLHRLQGLDALAPEAGYLLAVDSADGTIHYEAAFTTGVESATPLDGAPSLSFVDAPVWARGETSLQVEVSPVADPDGLGFVGVAFEESPEEAAAVWLVGEGGLFEAHAQRLEEAAPNEVCVVPVQWDAAGRRLAGETVCQAVEASLCSTASGASASAVAAALGLVALGRRRR